MQNQEHYNDNGFTFSKADPLDRLVALSHTLLSIAEQETQSLKSKNLNLFSSLQEKKKPISEQYLNASHEFRANISNYKTAPIETLNTLEDMQRHLQEKSSENSALMNQMTYQKSNANTGTTLFATQVLSQENSFQRCPPIETAPYSPPRKRRGTA